MAAKIVYKSNTHIGQLAAEDDREFLGECFVDLPIKSELLNTNSSKCILLGRTGSGKTAILNNIENTEKFTTRIDPNNVAFEYLANSNILTFLLELGCDLQVLTELLWRHILLSKAISCHFDNLNSLQSALSSMFSDDQTARSYIEKYGNTFWIEQDEVIKEISTNFESEIISELKVILGSDFAKIDAGLANKIALNEGQKKEIVSRTQHAVSNLQFRELQRAMESLNRLTERKQKEYFIIIDDLDLDWAPKNIKYQLINSLIESIRRFRKVRKVKVITAIRTDLYERSIKEKNSDGFQPEKIEGSLLQLKWSRKELHQVIEKRIAYLFKHQYVKSGVKFLDVFPAQIRKLDSFDYLISRTQMRPRDLIAFVNMILDKAAGGSEIVPKYVTDTESSYSNKRLDALCHEWKSVHPDLKMYLEVLKGQTGSQKLAIFASRERALNFCLQLEDGNSDGGAFDNVRESCKLYAKRENETRRFDVFRELVAVLYKVGAIDVRLQSGDTKKICYIDDAIITASEVGEGTIISVLPMLWRALGITPNLG